MIGSMRPIFSRLLALINRLEPGFLNEMCKKTCTKRFREAMENIKV